MKSKTKVIKIINLIVALLIAVFSIGYAFAWFIDTGRENEFKFGGSSGSAYFAGGTGTSTDPYLITDNYHMYNLAWLQNTGKFAGLGKLYFALGGNVDMGSLWLPPIGNDTDPFMGDFNGHGHTIKNLKITTDKNRLQNTPITSDYKFSNAVGLFGMTANNDGKSGTESAQPCNVHNFILDNPYIEVAGTDGYYAATPTTAAPNTGSRKAAGIAIGHVAGKASSIGVNAHSGNAATYAQAALDINRTGYSTFNSIIGELGSGVSSSVTGGGHDANSPDFGGSLNFLEIMQRMDYMNDNSSKWTSPKLEFNGLESTSSSRVTSHQYMSFVVDNGINETYYSKNTAESVPTTNLGYYIGNEAKIKPRAISSFKGEYTDVKDIPVYTAVSASQKQAVTLDADVRKDLDEMLNKTHLYGVRFNEQIEVATTKKTWMSIVGAKIAGHDGITITVPMHTVWFAAQKSGMAKFIFSSESNSTLSSGICVYRITRTGTSADNPYYTALESPSYVDSNIKTTDKAIQGQGFQYGGMDPNKVSHTQITSAYKNTLADGSVTYTYGAAATGATKSECIYNDAWYNSTTLSANGLFYTEFPLIEGYEYALGEKNSGGTWIMYMDVGQNKPAENSAVTDDAVSAVDFIYEGVEITQERIGTSINIGDFIVGGAAYEATGTSIVFTKLTYALKLVYVRKAVSEANTMEVTLSVTKDTEVDATNGLTTWINP